MEKGFRFPQIAVLVLGVILVVFLFIPTPGTGNMDTWVRWTKDAMDQGLIANYRINHDTYPPLTSVLLFSAGKMSQWLNIWIYTSIKLFIAGFLLVTFLVTLWVTKGALLALILLAALLINSVALGHLDVFFAPALVLALWALKKGKLTLFTVTFCLSFLTKWQPLIIGPFFALYILKIRRLGDWNLIDFKQIAKKVVLPFLAIAALAFMVFGIEPILTAFVFASDHHYLSGNALNLNWIITHFLHVFKPDAYGPLVNGQAVLIKDAPESIKLVPKLLFILVYVVTVVVFFLSEKTFRNLLLFSLLGYWAYFTLNTGVHENHLFIGIILAVLLFWIDKNHLSTMLLILLIGNVNLILFNGLDGIENQSSRVFSGIDMALVFAIFNVLAFSLFWVMHIFPIKTRKALDPLG